MGRNTTPIPKAPIARIILQAGSPRVSAAAAAALADIATERSLNIAKKAVEIAHHAGRKTVHASDIKLAASY